MSEATPEVVAPEAPAAPPPEAPALEPAPTEPAAPSWMDSAGIPDELRVDPSLKKFGSAEDVVKSYLESQKLIGKRREELLQDPELNRIRGVPDDPTGYGFESFEKPEDFPWDDGFALRLISSMHKHGLTKEQAQGLAKDYAEGAAADYRVVFSEHNEAHEKAIGELRQRWGPAFEEKVGLAHNAFRKLAGDGLGVDGLEGLKLVDGTMLGDHPAFLEVFEAIGARLGEDTMTGEASGRRFTMTPAEAQAELNKLHGDERSFGILNDRDHPEHGALQARKNALMEIIHPEPQEG